MLMNQSTRKGSTEATFVVAQENDAYVLECYISGKLKYVGVFPDSDQAFQFGDQFLRRERLLNSPRRKK